MSESKPPTATFLPGVIGFYLGIGTASLGGAVAAAGWFLLRDPGTANTVLLVGAAMMVLGFLAAIRFLKAARKDWK